MQRTGLSVAPFDRRTGGLYIFEIPVNCGFGAEISQVGGGKGLQGQGGHPRKAPKTQSGYCCQHSDRSMGLGGEEGLAAFEQVHRIKNGKGREWEEWEGKTLVLHHSY